MCDCPQDENDDPDEINRTSDDPRSGDHVQLFSSCSAPFDFRAATTSGQVTSSIGSSPDITANRSDDDIPTATDSSIDSSGEYKFADPRDFGYPYGEEEAPEYPLITCRSQTEESKDDDLDIECTLAIIKPDAMVHRDEIENRIVEQGFEVYQTRWVQLTPEQASDFYKDCYGQLHFAYLVTYMSSSPILVMVLAKQRGVEEWRLAIGPAKVSEARLYYPDTLRAMFGRCGDDVQNAVHGSANLDQAEREIHFFFPDFVVEPLIKGEMASDYLWEAINETLLEGLTLCCKRKPSDPILWLANWLILNNPNQPKLPEDIAMIHS
ncbi:nucleoside diphosphate kinase homolog 5-like [Athalia rosae]|uniref:nucleoside diphosphate kinase homolog 5-like n=1 Tax=Athalia rosae TaxID=37344 RepID=UPI002033F07F|nr:nucleoside diphosphate kinase homolog 5-like [Athalia rosae]